jgi:hypothetical protein
MDGWLETLGADDNPVTAFQLRPLPRFLGGLFDDLAGRDDGSVLTTHPEWAHRSPL